MGTAVRGSVLEIWLVDPGPDVVVVEPGEKLVDTMAVERDREKLLVRERERGQREVSLWLEKEREGDRDSSGKAVGGLATIQPQ